MNEWRGTYAYDFNGNMIWLLDEIWDSSKWVNYTRIFYTYDSNENMTEHSSEDWDGSNWVNYTRCTYTYDANGNMTYAINEKLQDGNWVASSGNIHFYDSFGNNVHEVKIYYSIIITDILAENKIITEYSLSQNYPNPFNPSTTIEYSIPVEDTYNATTTNVQLKIYDILGEEVVTLVNKKQIPGNYSFKFNASNLTTGIYFYRLISGKYTETKKLVILK